jgi:aminopeptidase YwaD
MKVNPFLEADRRMLGDIYTSSAAMDNLTVLCDDFGSRFAGTTGERQAVDFFLARFRDYRLENVHAEEYEYVGWTRGPARLEVVRPLRKEIPCISLPMCPPASVEAEMISVDHGAPTDFDKAGERLRQRIVMVDSQPPRGLPRTVHRSEKYQRSALGGAAAFLYANQYEGYGPETGSIANDRQAPIAGVAISRESAAYLLRLAERSGPVTLRIETTDRCAPARSWNVVGDLPGGSPNGEWVLMGCHYDGHDIAQGAVDPASGAVAVLEAARVLAVDAPPMAPPRHCGVRFVMFGTEEIGLLGAYRYVDTHRDELDRIRFMLNLDAAGGGSRKGIILNRWPDLEPFFENARREMAAEMPVGQKAEGFSDHFPFFLEGVPTGWMGDPERVDTGRGFGHTAHDTLDKVRQDNLRAAAANACRVVLRIACADGWPARRRTQDEVRAVIASEPSLEAMCLRDQMGALRGGAPE